MPSLLSFQSRHVPMRNPACSLIVTLVFAAVCDTSLATGMRFRFSNETFERRIQEQLTRDVSSIPLPKIGRANVEIVLRYPASEITRGIAWAGCGSGSVSKFNFEPRLSKLPDDPTLIIASAYLKCERIDIAVFQPGVAVAAYPAGRFGDCVYETMLISEHVEFSDEAILRQLFRLTVESATAVDDTWRFESDIDEAEPALTDFRRVARFAPELMLEFVGKTTLRVEMDFFGHRILIRNGDRWESYLMDPKSAATINDVVAAGRRLVRPFPE